METLADRFDRAQLFFDAEDFTTAARLLTEIVPEVPSDVATRLLLARAYFHSAQLSRAEAELRTVVDLAPTEDYALMMLGRTLLRQGRGPEGEGYLRLAAAMQGDS